jgi:PAS domain S-box-containing protein
VVVTFRNITQSHQEEQALRQFEERWRRALEGANQGVWDWDMKTNEVYYSPSYKKLYGFSDDDLSGMIGDWRDRIHPEDREKMDALINRHVQAESPYYETVYRIANREGKYLWIMARGIVLRKDTDGEPVRMIGTHTDISDRIEIEEELQKKIERFNHAAKASSEALWEWDIVSGDSFVSQNYTDLFGWTVDNDKRFEEWHDLIHPEDKEATIHDYYSCIANPEVQLWKYQYRYLKKDGTYAHVHDKAIILRDSKGKAVKVVGATQDISAQKLAEEELTKSNERFRLVSKATSDAIYDWNVLTNELYWGEGLKSLFGFQPEDVTIFNWKNLIHPDDRDQVNQSLNNCITSRKMFWKREYRYGTRDGEYRYVLDRGFIMRNEQGQATRMIGSMQDITENKYNERLLSLKNHVFKLSSDPKIEFNAVVHALLVGIEEIHTDAHTSVLLLEEDGTVQALDAPSIPAMFVKAINGLKLGPLDGSCGASMATKQNVIVEDIQRSPLWKNYKELAAQCGLAACWSLPIVHSSGKVLASFGIYFYEKKYPTTQELNTMERIRDILRILLENRWSIKEIKSAHERFDIILKATHDLIWDWSLERDTLYRDPLGVQKVYGVADGKSISNMNLWLERIHEEDRPHVLKIITEVQSESAHDMFEVEYRFRKDDGQYSYVYDRGILIRNAEGKTIRVIGAAQDITERKLLEKELLRNELERQKAINQATVDTQETERSEIGKELHDNVNQVLTTTKLYLDLAQSNPELKDELIQKSSQNIIAVINEIRQLSRTLMDPSIGDLGLIDSIQDLIENINLTRKLHVKLMADRKMEPLLDKNQKLTIFRIIQEALNNAVKHAQASQVTIHAYLINQKVTVIIQDNGIGFYPESIKRGAGLKNIQNRIYLINGTHQISSTPGQGCKIVIQFPVSLTTQTDTSNTYGKNHHSDR